MTSLNKYAHGVTVQHPLQKAHYNHATPITTHLQTYTYTVQKSYSIICPQSQISLILCERVEENDRKTTELN